MKTKVLIVGPSSSILIRQRVEMLLKTVGDVAWFSQSPDDVEGIPVYHHSFSRRFIKPIVDFIYLLWLLVYLRPSFVHVFYAKNRWLNLVIALHPRIIVTVMGSDISEKTVKKSSINFKLVKFLFNRSIVITSKSLFMDEVLKRFDVPSNKIQRITWGIDIEKFRLRLNSDKLRKQLKIPVDAHVFFSLRGCKPLYQHEQVLNAFGQFTHQYSNARLLISTMGAEEPYLSRLKQQASNLGIERKVIFLPTISNEDMPLYYSLSDAVVSVPKSDGMPQSLYESMACGCFHILGDLPQYYEIVESKKSGLYIELGDEEALADAFVWVVDNRDRLASLAEEIRDGILPLVNQTLQCGVLKELYFGLARTQIGGKE